jgi:large subunit ribosomal protein L31
MKKNIHPEYRQVVFRDRSGGLTFRTGSTMTSTATVEFEGETYPVIDVEISSASHPFWSGRERIIDTEGRVERFRRRYPKATS